MTDNNAAIATNIDFMLTDKIRELQIARHKIDNKIDNIDNKIDNIDNKIDILTEYKDIFKGEQKLLATSNYFILESTKTNFEAARYKLYKQGIKSSFDADKIILSNIKKHNMKSDITQECNGLILKRSDYKPLLIPPRSLTFNIDTDTANVFLHQGMYTIYKSIDGTSFNMYYYNNAWIIATALGYSMNTVAWEADTYQTLIVECFNDTWEKFCSHLDIERCYSFGFHNRKLHKFSGEVKNYIWFIQSVNLNTLIVDYTSPIASIKAQDKYMHEVKDMRILYRLASNALSDYVKTKNICYGFILRSKDVSKTNLLSDLYVESSLMRCIKKIWYDNNINQLCNSKQWNKEKAIVLESYLEVELQSLFITLFTQYKDQFNDIKTKLNDICDDILSDDLNKSEIAQHLAAQFNKLKQTTSNMNKEQKKNILLSFILDKHNFEVLYMHMYN